MAQFTSVGSRIADLDGFMGTVRFIGSVASSSSLESTYYGVEWDDHSRGKNDGSVIAKSDSSSWKAGDLVRHFNCTANGGDLSTAGSFLKIPEPLKEGGKKKKKKKAPTINFGTGLFSVLSTRYAEESDPLITDKETKQFLEGDCYAQTKQGKGRKKKIEFHGEEKLRDRQQVDQVDAVAVRSSFISYVESDYDVTQFSHLTELDVMGNLLSDWTEVFRILRTLKCITKFHLNGNLLNDINEIFNALSAEDRATTLFPNLKVLVVNSVNIKDGYKTLVTFSKMFPNLKELYLARNSFGDLGEAAETELEVSQMGDVVGAFADANLPPPPGAPDTKTTPALFPNLTLIDLSACGLSSWESQVALLSRIAPKIDTLILNDNTIPNIPKCSEPSPSSKLNLNLEQQETFPNLHSLQLSGNSLTSWASIDNLNSYKLSSLRFGRNPITKNIGGSESRSITIARIGSLKVLNSSNVEGRERSEAEKRYLRVVMRELSNKERDCASKEIARSEVSLAHPRFAGLSVVHAAAMQAMSGGIAAGSEQSGSSMASDTLNVTITSLASASCTQEPCTKRLPGSLTVASLRSMCKVSL